MLRMVLKLIFTIALLVAAAFFTGLNLKNSCDVWFFVKTFPNVPIFVTILISFAAGILVTLPAVFLRGERKLTPEQARALAERLEQAEKRNLEKQISRQKRLEEAKAKAQGVMPKKPLFGKKEKAAQSDAPAASAQDSSAPQENK